MQTRSVTQTRAPSGPDRTTLIRMLFDMHVVRAFETRLLACADEGLVTGPVHTSIGQEGVAAAILPQLRPGDQVVGNHRSHHHFLVQTLSRTVPPDWDPLTQPLPERALHLLTDCFAEILGRPGGVNNGAGGSMHLRNEAVGFAGSSAIVGGGIPLASGLAFAQRLRGDGGCAVCFIGDGAVNQGTFHETANLAAILRLPLLIVVENNGYAEATRPDEASALLPLTSQGVAHSLTALRVRDNDVLQTHDAARQLLAGIRRGAGPAMLEVETYRHLDHTGGAPGSAAGYRDAAEEARWRDLDPLLRLRSGPARDELLGQDEADAVAAAAGAWVDRAYRAVPPPGPTPVLDPYALLRGPAPSPPVPAPRPTDDRPRTLSFRDAIAEGIARAVRTDPDVVFLGEEVAKPGGLLAGAGCLDAGLAGTRIIDTPISEASFVGLAGGAAMAGLRPIVELMYGSFALIAADQLFNHIGAIRALYGNTAQAPVVIRAKVPTGLGYGPQHSLNPVALFTAFPGWRVHAPADPRDYLGVLNSALTGHDPVLLVEFSPLYGERHELTDADFAAHAPLTGARIVRPGTDVTIVTYGLGVTWSRVAADDLATRGVSAEIVDLRALDTPSLDWATLQDSLTRTGRGLFVDPAARGQAIGPRLIAELLDRMPTTVRMRQLACADVQPVAPVLERQAVLTAEDVSRAARRLCTAD
ncbi:thiamine pyrophosphate-dependent enzyme [Catellatospora sp. NPDC049111]|uniref:alpha-ketoacid dehydrogenase subunit alpha/beta n=1 Tax=Catellatospora sp. NPDC049111 TaxID=3155271 RepID=UPI0033E028CA